MVDILRLDISFPRLMRTFLVKFFSPQLQGFLPGLTGLQLQPNVPMHATHHADSRLNPSTPLIWAKGGPLSLRMAPGNPWVVNNRSKHARTVGPGIGIRLSSRIYRLWLCSSRTVKVRTADVAHCTTSPSDPPSRRHWVPVHADHSRVFRSPHSAAAAFEARSVPRVPTLQCRCACFNRTISQTTSSQAV